MNKNIAIDGPAGAGKSTIAKRVAKEIGAIYVDTGAMYRAVALFLLRNQVNEADEAQIGSVCRGAKVTIQYEEGAQQVFLNGENVSSLIRTEKVSRMTSISSANENVRELLLDLQRELARTSQVVMDGRDIGSHVLPDARVKIYLTASVETRAKRRYAELKEKGEDCVLSEIEEMIKERDERDMNRAIAPLVQAEGAVFVDSSDMTVDEVTERILTIYKEKITENL